MTAPREDADQLVDMMNRALESTIPIAHKIGVKLVEARRGFAATTVPAEGNGNHFGVIYAGVLFTVADVLGGIIPLITFDRDKYFPLVENLDIRFVAMAKIRRAGAGQPRRRDQCARGSRSRAAG